MGIKVITPPAALFTIAELRLHLRVDLLAGETTHPDDALILALADAAHGLAEHRCNRAIGSQTVELALDEFPEAAIELPRGPVASISYISYVDEDGATQVLDDSLYTLDAYDSPCWAIPAVDTDWPSTLEMANAVKVRYVVGDLPDAVRSGILLTIAHLYENRADTSRVEAKEIPNGACVLFDTAKIWGH